MKTNSKVTVLIRKLPWQFIIIWLICSSNVTAQDLSTKANDFLETLSPQLREEAQFSLTDDERFNMNFVPIIRKGPTFNQFNDRQSAAAVALLKASLGTQGYTKTRAIMELEAVLAIIENDQGRMSDGSLRRDPLNYHFCIFGTPSPTGFWGWRFEGHHISLNFTAARGDLLSSTPSFLGSNPGIVTVAPQKGQEVLKQETLWGFKLVQALDSEQLKIARFADVAPREIITGNKRQVSHLKPMGISYGALNADQQHIFDQLLNVYIDNFQMEYAKQLREKIKQAGITNLSFAWAGGLQPGTGHYYRIQGPTLLIEYDNVQNNANHVHSVVRDLTSDYAEDLLQEHYEKEH